MEKQRGNRSAYCTAGSEPISSGTRTNPPPLAIDESSATARRRGASFTTLMRREVAGYMLHTSYTVPGGGSTLYIPHTRRRDAAIYQCRAENGIHPAGVSTVSLQVTYPPTIRPSFEEKVSVLFGQKVDFSVQCEADGNPSPKVRWRRKDTPLYFDNPLRFSRVGYGEEGHYQCIASSKGFPDAIRETYINVIGKPDVLGEPTSLAVTRGDSVSLVCEVASDPDPKEITWMWRGSDVDGDQQFPVGSDGNVRVRQESYEGGKSVKSVLTIQNTNSGRTGDYVCKAVNMFGSDQRQFSVEIIEPPTTMLAIVVAVVSVVVVLFVLFAICVARRKGWICDETISVTQPSPTQCCCRVIDDDLESAIKGHVRGSDR
ncbi:hypothetical protein Bbelb_235890 [Branchiostoma belcheri]|nr:hypothetical protein Bbelb_235890 [Branchiostoma belcheri]